MNTGGPGSQERQDALGHAGGVQRRNSIDQARALHGVNPTGAAGGQMNSAQFEALRHGGHVGLTQLMQALPSDSERNWDPARGGGRDQIRTGRNFQVPDAGGGRAFDVRVHTNDLNRPVTDHAGSNAVLRVTQGQRVLMAQAMPHPDARMGNVDWANLRGNDAGMVNAAHVPLQLPPPAPLPPPPRGFMPGIGDAARGAGAFAWDAVGGSHLVGGVQQAYENMQAGGSWGGVATGVARAAAGGAMMASLTTLTPMRAASAAVFGGVTSAGRYFGLWR